jgi:hypothetical protein
MDGTLFNIEDYTDERVRRIMQGKTCRTCDNRVRHEYSKSTYYCKAHESGRTANGLLKVKANQPACIRYTNQDNQNNHLNIIQNGNKTEKDPHSGHHG